MADDQQPEQALMDFSPLVVARGVVGAATGMMREECPKVSYAYG